ncbi:MAG: hypothetical protein LBH98_01320 [Chitinispirillales bacterium]|jgi:hypothetical protein|nr:hypothetical protein [Chitinispirillales bacterium]
MNKFTLSATNFVYNFTFYNQEFENILKEIIACYYCIVSENKKLPSNNENTIRDIILKDYLKNRTFKEAHFPLDKYLFDKEISEDEGRVDIRIMNIKPFTDDYTYYIIECKRLNNENTIGETGLNAKYIYEGIARFTSNKYSMYKNTAGMIGFVVEKMDIRKNISNIRTLLKQNFNDINTEQNLKYKKIASGFDYSYFSKHKINGVSKIIYHLMFDFSDNITHENLL